MHVTKRLSQHIARLSKMVGITLALSACQTTPGGVEIRTVRGL